MSKVISFLDGYIQSTIDLTLIANNTAPYLYLVAVLAILYNYSKYTVQYLSINANTKNSSFISYQFVFSIILSQCLYLVFLVEGAKQQIGVIVWIIYVSALMVLFLIFLALTIAESFFSISVSGRQSTSKYNPDSTSNSNIFTLLSSTVGNIMLCAVVTVMSYIIAYELNSISCESSSELQLSSNSYNYSLCNSRNITMIDSAPIFTTIKRDIVNSISHYALSGLLQAATLIVVILGLIH